MTPQQRQKCAEEIVTKIRSLIEKIQANPSAPKPPPGAISKEVALIMEKHEKAAEPARPSMVEAVKVAVAAAPKLEDLTPENVYVKPPAQENVLLTAVKTAVATSPKPWRVGALADSLKQPKDAVIAAINTPGSGLTVVKPGWVKRA